MAKSWLVINNRALSRYCRTVACLFAIWHLGVTPPPTHPSREELLNWASHVKSVALKLDFLFFCKRKASNGTNVRIVETKWRPFQDTVWVTAHRLMMPYTHFVFFFHSFYCLQNININTEEEAVWYCCVWICVCVCEAEGRVENREIAPPLCDKHTVAFTS